MCKDRKRRVCTGYAGKRGVGRMESGREPVSTRHGALLSEGWENIGRQSRGAGGLIQLFATPGTVPHQAPLSMEFPRQEYWSGLLFPSPGDLPNPGIEPTSPALQVVSRRRILYQLSHLNNFNKPSGSRAEWSLWRPVSRTTTITQARSDVVLLSGSWQWYCGWSG